MFALVRSFVLALVLAFLLAIAAPESRVAAMNLPTDHYARVILESRAAPSYYDSKNLEVRDSPPLVRL